MDLTAIIAARALAYVERGHWTTYAEARTGVSVFSLPCAWDDPRAQAWCLMGIVKKVIHDYGGEKGFSPAEHRQLLFTFTARAEVYVFREGYRSLRAYNDLGYGRRARVTHLLSTMRRRARVFV